MITRRKEKKEIELVSLDFENIDDKIYFNIAIISNDFTKAIPAIYQQQFNLPIVEIPEDYYFSVIRFSIPTQSTPLMIGQVSGGVNNTIWSVTIQNGLTENQQFIQWIPSDINIPNTNEAYYYLYKYTPFITMINNALITAFNNVFPIPGSRLPPYFQLEVESGRMSLIAQQQFYETNVGNTNIFVNYPLTSFIDGIPKNRIGFTQPNGKDFQIIVANNRNNWYNPSDIVPVSPPEFLRVEEEYPCLSNWNGFKSLQISSNLLPIRKEYVPSLDSDGILSGMGIISDFIPILEQNASARTNVEFINSSPYRLINLYGKAPISKIDVRVDWTDKFGKSHLLYVPYNQILTMKFIFIKKSTFTS